MSGANSSTINGRYRGTTQACGKGTGRYGADATDKPSELPVGGAARRRYLELLAQESLDSSKGFSGDEQLPTSALARLGLARAYAAQKDTVRARAAYQDFLTLWRDADPDIPILKEAKAEYAKLQ